jgi:hypothetical protein
MFANVTSVPLFGRGEIEKREKGTREYVEKRPTSPWFSKEIEESD